MSSAPSHQSTGADVLIVGAGIVGAACAAEFTRAGLSTIIVDKGPVSTGATAAGMGQIVVMDDNEAEFALTNYSQQLWNEMADELPAAVDWDECGSLWIAADDEEMQEVERKHSFYSERGIETEVLKVAALERLEPNLRPGFRGGLRMPGDSVIYSPCAAGWFIEQACQRGAELRLGQKVIELRGHGALLENGDFLQADITVNAAGSWAAELMPELPIRPRKGHLVITDRYPGFIRHQLVELGYLKSAHSVATDSVAFNVQPRKTGQLLIGSSRQYDDETRDIDPDILKRMIDRALGYLPGLAELSAIRTWTGFRAATPDSQPLIGPSIDDEHLFLATGREGLGITTSLGTARLLVDQVLGRESAIPCEPYLPSRFRQGGADG